jgi:hypothetical protein
MPYGPPPPSAPAPVVIAAVLAFLVGAFGVLGTLLVVVVGPVLFGLAGGLGDAEAQTAARFGAAVTFGVGLLMLGWTVAMIWGGVRALRGRGRPLVIVAGSIGLALMLVSFVGTVSSEFVDPTAAAFSLVFLLASLAIVVLPWLPSSSRFFAAHRQRRGGAGDLITSRLQNLPRGCGTSYTPPPVRHAGGMDV